MPELAERHDLLRIERNGLLWRAKYRYACSCGAFGKWHGAYIFDEVGTARDVAVADFVDHQRH